jgi:hypothetical protein
MAGVVFAAFEAERWGMNEFDPWVNLANTLSNSHERVKFRITARRWAMHGLGRQRGSHDDRS